MIFKFLKNLKNFYSYFLEKIADYINIFLIETDI